MLTQVASTVIGLIILVWSADRFVLGAAALARNFGMSTLMIGLTVVSLGTSAPEIFVSLSAALSGAPELAIGNVLGSNIANIALVLAITTMVAPIPIQRVVLHHTLPVLVLITAIAGFCLHDLYLGRIDGVILLISLVILGVVVFFNPSSALDDNEELEQSQLSNAAAAGWFLFSLVLLVASSKMLVWGASGLARSFGVSELVIGLTLVAVGTSLPELAASIASALKKLHGIAIGNVIGSNILNILTVLPLPGLILPSTLDANVWQRDYATTAGLTLLLFALVFIASRSKTKAMGRAMGLILFSSYLAYYAVLAFNF